MTFYFSFLSLSVVRFLLAKLVRNEDYFKVTMTLCSVSRSCALKMTVCGYVHVAVLVFLQYVYF